LINEKRLKLGEKEGPELYAERFGVSKRIVKKQVGKETLFQISGILCRVSVTKDVGKNGLVVKAAQPIQRLDGTWFLFRNGQSHHTPCSEREGVGQRGSHQRF
jgi:hypothetical protein